jgi:hypothetical protein
VTIPGPGDSDYPVPPAWFSPESQPITNSFVARAKSDDYFERRIRYWERMCTDPVYLTEVSLAELAAIIEANVYDAVRYRWASEPAAMRPDPPTPGEPLSDGWDEPRYDHLPDTYSMHLHPVYWKFHGWVADRVEDWKVANGVSGRDFWKATWVGKLPDDLQPSGRCPPGARDLNPLFAALLDEDVAARHLEEMEQVVAIIAEAEVADQ